MSFSLKTPESYDLLSSIHSWIFPDVQPVPEVTTTDTLSRIFTIDDNKVPITIQQRKPSAPLKIECPYDDISEREIKNKLNRILNFDLQMDATHRKMIDDPILSEIGEVIRGVRPYLTDTVYEGLMKSIIQQQISYRAANVITKRIVLGFSKDKSMTNSFYQFPSAKEIVSAGVEKLRSFGLGYKTEFLYDLCLMIGNGDLDTEGLRGRSYTEAYEILSPIRGIGEWTIQALAIAGLGIYTTFPFGDLAIQNVLGKLYRSGKRFSKQEVIDYSENQGDVGPLILYLLMCADARGIII